MHVLDDMMVVGQHDRQNKLDSLLEQPAGLLQPFVTSSLQPAQPITKVVSVCDGVWRVPALLVETWPTLAVPYVVCDSDTLPRWLDETTLVIVMGSEVMSHAVQRQVQDKGVCFVAMTEVLLEVKPTSVFVAYRALLDVLLHYHLIDKRAIDTVTAAVQPLTRAAAAWAKEVPSADNLAKQIALHIMGKTPIIYAGSQMAPAALYWKIECNLTARSTAWYGVHPRDSAYEHTGWTSHPVQKPFAVLDLVSSFESEAVTGWYTSAERTLSGQRPQARTIEAQGSTMFEHGAYLSLLGCFSMAYLALLYGHDPGKISYNRSTTRRSVL